MTAPAQSDSRTTIQHLAGQDVAFDNEGYFLDDSQWNEEVCRDLAAQRGLTDMRPEHWRILYAYREYYTRNGRAPLHRDLKAATGMSVMDMERLFPDGLKFGARRLCGLPNPKTCQ